MATFRPKEVFQQARQAEAQGKPAEAATHYASLSSYLRRRGKYEEAITLVRRALSLAPQVTRLHLQLALTAELHGDKETAERALAYFTEKVIERNKAEEYREFVEKMLQETPRLRQLFFDRLLQLDRTSAASFLGRARSLMAQGDSGGALRVLLDALQTRTHEEEVLNEIEKLLRSEKRSEGLIHLERFRDGKISAENFHVLLKGQARVEATGESAPTGVGERNLKDLIGELESELGVELEKPQEEIAPLLKEFRRRSQPVLGQDPRAHLDMALAFFEMGLVKEAQEEIGTIPETDPLYGEALVLLGETFLSSGSDLSALDAFQRSLRASSKTADVEREARYKLVLVFFRLGDLSKAFSEAAELEKMAPDYRELRRIKNEIQEALEKCAV